MQSDDVDSHFDYLNAEFWKPWQLADFLGVSLSWVWKKIKNNEIITKNWGRINSSSEIIEQQHYKISRDEVKRVLLELPMPRRNETFAERMKRGWDRIYRETGIPSRKVIDQILNLEDPRIHNKLTGEIEYSIDWRHEFLKATHNKPRPRKNKLPSEGSN